MYERWALAIYRRALGLLGDPDEALDVTQEAFISLFQRLARVGNDAAALGLLYQAATFQAIDRVRRRSRWASRLSHLAPSMLARAELEAHQTGARQVEAAQELALLLRGESPKARTAALLHFVGGYTFEEVGGMLSLSSRTVGRMLERFGERARKRGARQSRPDSGMK